MDIKHWRVTKCQFCPAKLWTHYLSHISLFWVNCLCNCLASSSSCVVDFSSSSVWRVFSSNCLKRAEFENKVRIWVSLCKISAYHNSILQYRAMNFNLKGPRLYPFNFIWDSQTKEKFPFSNKDYIKVLCLPIKQVQLFHPVSRVLKEKKV